MAKLIPYFTRTDFNPPPEAWLLATIMRGGTMEGKQIFDGDMVIFTMMGYKPRVCDPCVCIDYSDNPLVAEYMYSDPVGCHVLTSCFDFGGMPYQIDGDEIHRNAKYFVEAMCGPVVAVITPENEIRWKNEDFSVYPGKYHYCR